MALPPERISELKQIIHSQLSRMDLKSKIRDVLSERMSVDGESPRDIGEEEMLEALRQNGIIDEILGSLHFESAKDPQTLPALVGQAPVRPATHFINPHEKVLKADSVKKANVDPSRRYLYLQILGGRAFLEHLQQEDPYPGIVTPMFTIHILFRGQRFKSRPVACACEPDIQEGFLLELHKESAGEAARMVDNASMLSLSDQVHLALMKTEASGENVLVSSHYLEWRPVLSAPACKCNLTIELLGIGAEHHVPVGVLELRMELLPKTPEQLSEDVIKAQISMEKNKQAERERLFLVYAKQWWKEYLQIRSVHKERLIKIFAQDENSCNRPVCSYIHPLRAGRLIDTPREAARFVSLISYEKTLSLGGGSDRQEQWSTMHSFLCRNKGDCEDHCVLLCSLLLGFGLDAYICVGTKTKGATHSWVMTRNTDGLVTFWESLTGHRYIHNPINPEDPPEAKQSKQSYPYKTVGCVFNHESFFANCQAIDTVEVSVFDLYDQSRWKQMSEDALRSICTPGNMPSWPSLPPLCSNLLDSSLASNDLEQQLRAIVSEFRKDQGLNTTWDDHLSYLLTPALAAYETERITGVSAGNEEFQQAIRRAVPDGHTFKGYPIQFVHRNARKAFSACLKSPVCEEIINCRGDHIRLGVRVKVFTYPEQASAVWIMFACKYKSVA